MPVSQAYDSNESQDLAWPYAPNAGALIDRDYYMQGLNAYVTWGGTLKKRPGNLTVGVAAPAGKYPDRLWSYETLEASPVVYLVGSFKVSGVWQLWYSKVSSLGAWTLASERRGSNHSQFAHEAVVRRGKLYVKAFPNSTDDPTKLGCVYLDGTGGTMATHDWGALGPQTPVALTNPAGWSASAHSVTVNNSWIYTYTYVKVSGQETNQAPLQTNPDLSPSASGPFTNKIPTMSVTGLADTTEYPFINVYRTTDGGGTFFFLHQIANTGAGTITFHDTFLASGSGNQDPLPDSGLDTAHQAPSLTSNSPPPSVAPPQVTGTDTLVQSSRVVQYAARIWFAVNEYLFYSANEELNEGVPEESYPSGEASPNFFRMDAAVTNLIPTPDGLLVMTHKNATMIYGTSKATFNPLPFLGDIGAAPGQPRAACTASESVAWLTHDMNIAMVRGGQFALLTKPIGDAVKNAVQAGASIDMTFWVSRDKEYLVIAAERADDTTATRWFVYDIDRARRVSDDFWFPPWAVRSTAICVGPTSVSDTSHHLFSTLWDGTTMLLVKLDPTGVTASDPNPTSGTATAFPWNITTALRAVPAGDHVNERTRPILSPVFAKAVIDRTTYTGDSDPTVKMYCDDLFNTAIPLGPADPPPRRTQSQGFKTLEYNLGAARVAKYVALFITGNTDTKQAELQTMTWAFIPSAGA